MTFQRTGIVPTTTQSHLMRDHMGRVKEYNRDNRDLVDTVEAYAITIMFAALMCAPLIALIK